MSKKIELSQNEVLELIQVIEAEIKRDAPALRLILESALQKLKAAI